MLPQSKQLRTKGVKQHKNRPFQVCERTTQCSKTKVLSTSSYVVQGLPCVNSTNESLIASSEWHTSRITVLFQSQLNYFAALIIQNVVTIKKDFRSGSSKILEVRPSIVQFGGQFWERMPPVRTKLDSLPIFAYCYTSCDKKFSQSPRRHPRTAAVKCAS